MPKTRLEFWHGKFNRNIARDQTNLAALHAGGWHAEVVWECETKPPDRLEARLEDIFGRIVEL